MPLHGTTTADHTHVDDVEAQHAADVTGDTPDLVPAPTRSEPVLLGAGAGLAATIGALIAAGVPWYGAVGLLLVLSAIAAWQRGQVTPVR